MRITKIELENVKTVNHGVVSFRNLPSGGSVTGIYGQNGSGKTALIDAVSYIDFLISGSELPDGSSNIIRIGSNNASIAITLGENGLDRWEYRVVLSRPEEGSRAVLTSESLKDLSHEKGKRQVLSWKKVSSEDSGPFERENALVKISWTPFKYWKSVESFSTEARKIAGGIEALAMEGERSAFFSGPISHLFSLFASFFEEKKKLGDAIPDSKEAAGAMLVLPFCRAGIDFAVLRKGLRVLPSLVSNMPTMDFIYIPSDLEPGKENTPIFSLGSPSVHTEERVEELEEKIRVLNPVLESLVPGLTMELRNMGAELLEDGSKGARVDLLSSRDGVKVPLRYESDGIKKLVSILSLLVLAYGDEGGCVFIDELDSGIFEFLLGEILQSIAGGGRGQLVFTAHNLRPLEILPTQCIVMTSTDANDRYQRFKGSKATNNLRDQYLRAVLLGGQKHPVYRPTDRARIDSAFWKASKAKEIDSDFDSFLNALKGGADA